VRVSPRGASGSSGCTAGTARAGSFDSYRCLFVLNGITSHITEEHRGMPEEIQKLMIEWFGEGERTGLSTVQSRFSGHRFAKDPRSEQIVKEVVDGAFESEKWKWSEAPANVLDFGKARFRTQVLDVFGTLSEYLVFWNSKRPEVRAQAGLRLLTTIQLRNVFRQLNHLEGEKDRIFDLATSAFQGKPIVNSTRLEIDYQEVLPAYLTITSDLNLALAQWVANDRVPLQPGEMHLVQEMVVRLRPHVEMLDTDFPDLSKTRVSSFFRARDEFFALVVKLTESEETSRQLLSLRIKSFYDDPGANLEKLLQISPIVSDAKKFYPEKDITDRSNAGKLPDIDDVIGSMGDYTAAENSEVMRHLIKSGYYAQALHLLVSLGEARFDESLTRADKDPLVLHVFGDFMYLRERETDTFQEIPSQAYVDDLVAWINSGNSHVMLEITIKQMTSWKKMSPLLRKALLEIKN